MVLYLCISLHLQSQTVLPIWTLLVCILRGVAQVPGTTDHTQSVSYCRCLGFTVNHFIRKLILCWINRTLDLNISVWIVSRLYGGEYSFIGIHYIICIFKSLYRVFNRPLNWILFYELWLWYNSLNLYLTLLGIPGIKQTYLRMNESAKLQRLQTCINNLYFMLELPKRCEHMITVILLLMNGSNYQPFIMP